MTGSPRTDGTTGDRRIALGGTYEPPSTEHVPSRPPVVVPDESDVPPAAPGERDVWLAEWQVDEDHFDVRVGEHVAWHVVDADGWADVLFGGRRPVHDDRDTYADDLDRGPARALAGVVVRVDQVSVRYRQAADGSGLEAVPGSAMQHDRSSIWPKVPHHGAIVGWIARVRLD